MPITAKTTNLLGAFGALLDARAEAARTPGPAPDIQGAAKLDKNLAFAVKHVKAAREDKIARARSMVATALDALKTELATDARGGPDAALARKICEVVTAALADPDLPHAG